MARIAVVGTENSHARGIVRHLSGQVTVLVGPDDDHNRQLMELGGITRLVPTSAELVGAVDALIVTNRDGALHRQHAVPFLEAGIPVWVDKPLAASTADARAILDTATRTGTPVTSYSAIRWLPDADILARAVGEVGEIQAVTVTGPADPESEYSGIFFYGIHTADLAQRIAPGEPEEIQVERSGDTVVARYRSNGVAVTLQLVNGSVPFHAEIVGRAGSVSREIRLDADYLLPSVEVFLEMLRTGKAPLDAATMLAPITVLEAING